jgi:hypothetical protein
MNVLRASVGYDTGRMLTQEQKQRISEALAAKHLSPCQACRVVGTWAVGDALVLFPLHYWSGISFGTTGQSYPCVPVLCSNCGNMMFHNAFTLGVAGLLGLTCAPTLQTQAGRNG